jgi:hypothetical protein
VGTLCAVKLTPTTPPGSSRRKALAFAGEIARLHREGYTLEVIRQTLADAGVEVSWSTVQREAWRATAAANERTTRAAAPAKRTARKPPTRPPGADRPPTTALVTSKRVASEGIPAAKGSGSAKAPSGSAAQSRKRAAEFVQKHFAATNPLMKPRSKDEDRGP